MSMFSRRRATRRPLHRKRRLQASDPRETVGEEARGWRRTWSTSANLTVNWGTPGAVISSLNDPALAADIVDNVAQVFMPRFSRAGPRFNHQPFIDGTDSTRGS